MILGVKKKAEKKAASPQKEVKEKKTATVEKPTVKPRAQDYDVLRFPVITEKSTRLSEQNKIVFKVSLDASKAEVKRAVEALLGVKVEKVNTLVVGGKNKVFRGRPGKRSDQKKAIVTLAPGQVADLAAGAK
jgi:large subunit ribosomal protein L23